MTEQDIKEIEERANAASNGLWSADHINAALRHICRQFNPEDYCWDCSSASEKNLEVCSSPIEGDGEFIAKARADIPNLVDEVKRLREVIAQGIYPHEDFLVNVCPWCEGYSKNNSKDPNATPAHTHNCPAFNPDGSVK